MKCGTCNREFRDSWVVKRHIDAVHRNKKTLKCTYCSYVADNKIDMLEHKRKEHLTCSICLKVFTSLFRLNAHKRTHQSYLCQFCGESFKNVDLLKTHETTHQQEKEKKVIKETVKPARSAFRGLLSERRFLLRGQMDPLATLEAYKRRIYQVLEISMKRQGSQKFTINLSVRFKRNQTEAVAYFNGGMHTLNRLADFEDLYQNSKNKIYNSFDAYLRLGSGWIVDRLEILYLNSYKYTPIQITSYIPTPQSIIDKRAIINIKNKDFKCFEYSVLASLCREKIDTHSANNPSLYKPFLGVLKGCKEPMTIDDIPKFEKLNDIAIAVYRIKHNGNTIFPLYISKFSKIKEPIKLLLIEKNQHHHFCYIKDFNGLLREKKAKHSKVFCPFCCYGFLRHKNGESNLKNHKLFCESNGAQRTKYLSEPDNYIEFDDFEKQQKMPFCIYADFETLNTNANDESISGNIELKTAHIPSGFTFYTASQYFTPRKVTYRGSNAAQIFLKEILKEKDRIIDIMNAVIPIDLSSQEEKYYQSTSVCHICRDELKDNHKKGHKVRDHCHFTGKFRGAAHNVCNLKFRVVKKIPVFFHNLAGYDSHLIFKSLNQVEGISEPKVIAKAMENFITFSIDELNFKDSLNFLSSSLEKLTTNLAAKAENKEMLKNVFPNLYMYFKKSWANVHESGFEMLTRKGVYPYSYMKSFDNFQEKSLPSKEIFFNELTQKHITDEDYTFVCDLWNKFNLKDLGQLHNLYMDTDVLLLADVFEEFRRFCLLNYKLDPAHFNTAPALSWSAALLHTKQKLEIPTDPDMHLFFDRGMRGGASQIGFPYAKANHVGLDKYDSEKQKTFINLFDCNNQYGYAMQQYLPTDGFVWVQDSLNDLNYWTQFILKQNDCQNIGYFFEIDLEYPDELHDLHDEYPLAPHHLEIHDDMLSTHQKRLSQELNVKTGGKKLCLTLLKKTNYVCHYRNLKYYLEKGLKVVKIHQILKFNQSPWLASYIDLNTKLRQEAKNKFSEGFAKLMNNSFFGKTCEDTRKHRKFTIALNEKRAKRLICKPTLKKSKIYDENLVTFEHQKDSVYMNKPRYIGQTILDISKIVMYQFHYDFMMIRYPDSKLLFTDTDSLCYLIPTDGDIYKDIEKKFKWFDFSNYPSNHPNYTRINHLIPGKFKDEMGGVFIIEFCGLRSKMYSILKDGGGEKKTGNGILEQVKNDYLSHENYRESLFNQEVMHHEARKIFQKDHQLYIANVKKITLNPFNDKKWIMYENGIFRCYSYGNKKIRKV